MKPNKIPKKDIDYVEIYSKELVANPKIFKQQKDLIESQMEGSSSLMKKRFQEENFKTQARIYLKKFGLLRDL